MRAFSVYIHIPFCLKRCSYCDFNTYAGRDSLIPTYIKALRKEIKCLGSGVEEEIPVYTIYFGGGTPSLLSPDQLSKIFTTLEDVFTLVKPIEITLEANPGTVSLSYFQDLRVVGFNRISLGVQSAHPRELALLGRQHDFMDVINAVRWARQAGFNNLSLDMIFGIPGQTMSDWERSLRSAIDLTPDHFSLYGLTIEANTLMNNWYSRGLITPQNPDLEAEMYERANELLTSAGYQQYEISNWARKNSVKVSTGVGEQISTPKTQATKKYSITLSELSFLCRHNLQYWRNLPYLGFGAGAHGFVNGFRTVNKLRLEEYIHSIETGSDGTGYSFPQGPGTFELIPIDRATEIQEFMMMGLRLTIEGVSDREFQTRFGIPLLEQFGNEIRKNIEWGLLEWIGESLRLTPRGRLLGNRVFSEFI